MIGCRFFFIWFLIERHEPIPGCFRWKKETLIFNIYICKTCININFTKMFTSTPTPPLYLRPPNLSQLYRKDTRSSDCPWSFNLHFHSKELSSSDGIWNKGFNVDCPWYNRYFSGLSDRGQKIFFWCPLQIECFIEALYPIESWLGKAWVKAKYGVFISLLFNVITHRCLLRQSYRQ